MSDTKRNIDKIKHDDQLTEKFLSRDKSGRKKLYRFSNGIKNIYFNLLKKINDLRLKESLEEKE